MGPAPWKGAVKEEMFPRSGDLLYRLGGSVGQIGSFRGLRGQCGNRPAVLQGRESAAQTILAMPLHFPACDAPAGVCSSWVLQLRLQQTDPGRDSGWVHGDSPTGLERGTGHTWGCAQQERGPALEPVVSA